MKLASNSLKCVTSLLKPGSSFTNAVSPFSGDFEHVLYFQRFWRAIQLTCDWTTEKLNETLSLFSKDSSKYQNSIDEKQNMTIIFVLALHELNDHASLFYRLHGQ